MSLVVGNTPGTDLALREDKVKGYKHFANKLWNIARFILENTEDVTGTPVLTDADSALRAECDALVIDITKDLEEYRVYLAAEKIYHYVWDRLASEILEESKILLAAGGAASESRKKTLRALLDTSLRLLHPFMPFVTEEIWQHLPESEGFLMVAEWPGAKV